MVDDYSFKWETLYATIGKKISQRRKELTFSQQDIAGKVNLTRVSISNIEQGRQKVSLQNLYRLAAALQIDIADLVPNYVEIGNINLEKEIDRHLKKQEKYFVSKILSEEEGK